MTGSGVFLTLNFCLLFLFLFVSLVVYVFVIVFSFVGSGFLFFLGADGDLGEKGLNKHLMVLPGTRGKPPGNSMDHINTLSQTTILSNDL